MAGGNRRKNVIGIQAIRGPEGVWTWNVYTRSWRMDENGNVEEFMADGSLIRRAILRTIEAGIAYSVGFCEGQTCQMPKADTVRFTTTEHERN